MQTYHRLALGLGVMLVLGGLVLVPCSCDAITKKSFEKIKKGISEQEVCAILGHPSSIVDADCMEFDTSKICYWRGCSGTTTIVFNMAGRAKYISFVETNWHNSPAEFVWRWIKGESMPPPEYGKAYITR
jgi:hypothetical protein